MTSRIIDCVNTCSRDLFILNTCRREFIDCVNTCSRDLFIFNTCRRELLIVLTHVHEIYLYSTHVVENYKDKTRVEDEEITIYFTDSDIFTKLDA